ncbi:hypothetical protein SAMN05443287_11674 [Micromonospora phaseoli]|uniref:Condensation domain-containing protein n=1 Tax=Micromonospora phaseoli TaxID=1144548 RepID=A0A1H7DR13_9ACTN|nr:hypothetical protein [Micromonospora phaseoli]PZV89974.1 hypothetical protein CLV64_11461 [Micromonospora phaseoli]GIJ78812.1 hypothetical protein Xph01_32440 [Micromonospora phaseoli]SEK04203.1 hypothetical protein SAMN05443287_11674 [Micromonospora phaseoli]
MNLTRAQKFQWYLEKGLAEGVHALPDPSVAGARNLVAALTARFEVLRTSIDHIDGEPRQVLHDTGDPLRVIDLDTPDELRPRMAALAEEFRLEQQGRPGALLARFFLLRTADSGWLGMVADNVAVDAAFHRVIEQETSRILGEPAGPDVLGGAEGIQPLAAAALEAGTRGTRDRERAAEMLRCHFATAPPRMHRRRPPGATAEGRYYRRVLEIPDADRLFAQLLAAGDTLPSALVLAAFTQLMCVRSDQDDCTVNVSMDNRHNRELRLTLCATAQRVPVTLSGAGRTLRAHAADVQRVLVDGYPVYGRYDPLDLIAERDGAQRRRGMCLTPDLAFNFVPPPQGWTSLLTGATRPLPVQDGTITGSTTGEVSYEYAASLSMRWADARAGRISIHGDSEALPPGDAAALLRGIELMLVRWADGRDSEPERIAGETGLSAPQRPGTAIRAGGRWIDVDPISRMLCERNDVVSAEVRTDPGDEARLIAYVMAAPGTNPRPDDLHAALLPAVGTGSLLVIPDRYEITDRTENACPSPPNLSSLPRRSTVSGPTAS